MTFALAILVAAIAVGGGDAVAQRPPQAVPCGPPQAKTLIADPAARFFSVGRSGSRADSTAVYGCIKGGPNRRIGPAKAGGRIWAAELVGPYAIEGAWLGATEHRLIGQDAVEVLEIARSAERSGAGSQCSIGVGDRPGQVSVRRTLISAAGVVAWAARINDKIILAYCSHSEEIVVSEAPGLMIGSVSISGSSLRWRDEAGAHATSLSG